MRFEWDDSKATANLRKHGVGFEEAAEVFYDPYALVEDDGENVTIEVSEEDHRRDIEAGMTEDEPLKPGRYKLNRGASSSTTRS